MPIIESIVYWRKKEEFERKTEKLPCYRQKLEQRCEKIYSVAE